MCGIGRYGYPCCSWHHRSQRWYNGECCKVPLCQLDLGSDRFRSSGTRHCHSCQQRGPQRHLCGRKVSIHLLNCIIELRKVLEVFCWRIIVPSSLVCLIVVIHSE